MRSVNERAPTAAAANCASGGPVPTPRPPGWGATTAGGSAGGASGSAAAGGGAHRRRGGSRDLLGRLRHRPRAGRRVRRRGARDEGARRGDLLGIGGDRRHQPCRHARRQYASPSHVIGLRPGHGHSEHRKHSYIICPRGRTCSPRSGRHRRSLSVGRKMTTGRTNEFFGLVQELPFQGNSLGVARSWRGPPPGPGAPGSRTGLHAGAAQAEWAKRWKPSSSSQ